MTVCGEPLSYSLCGERETRERNPRVVRKNVQSLLTSLLPLTTLTARQLLFVYAWTALTSGWKVVNLTREKVT